MVLRGESKFSITALCTEAGVDRAIFRMHFTGKTAVMAALMHSQSVSAPVAVAVPLPVPQQIPEPVPQPAFHTMPQAIPQQVAKPEAEPTIVAADAWLERRLRVFERALNALETKAETTAREQARAIALLEEKLGAAHTAVPQAGCSAVAAPGVPQTVPAKAPDLPREPNLVAPPRPAVTAPAAHRVEQACVKQEEVAPAEEMRTPPQATLFVAPPQPPATISKEEMADVLQSARDKARAAAVVEPMKPLPPPDTGKRTRWLVIGGLAGLVTLAVLSLYIGLLGKGLFGASATAQESDGVAHRNIAKTGLSKTKALADAGDARAQARLALAYLRGQGSAGDANAALLWSRAAAEAGNPMAEYLLGVMYQQGEHVPADSVKAFAWFSRAAEKGNLKGMHNLAIAYAQGLGTAKDEAKAAEWFTRAAERGYVDSAFDLAVLYERGTGVKQDLKQALKWYDIAAMAGDAPSKERVDFLRTEMPPADVKLAANAALSFSPLPALEDANKL
jgi:TPR repeat protein